MRESNATEIVPPHDSTVAAALAAASRARNWLLHGPAQLRNGPQVGGVAGILDVNGKPQYVYAEITGYYLSWLADVASLVEPETVRENAEAAVGWATRAFAKGDAPATRIYLETQAPDWRNDAVFFFDLAMLLYGLHRANAAGIAHLPAALRETVYAQLTRFVKADSLCCALPLSADAVLPPRWSTGGGAFLVKASSRVAHSAQHAPLPVALAHACAMDSAHWAPLAAQIDLDMLHPTLYFAEGLLLSRPDCAEAVAHLLARCLDLIDANGNLPETAGIPGKTRNDILAQALRIGVLLRTQEVAMTPTLTHLDHLAATLVARIDASGFLPFDAKSAGQANVWCTMFAEQALRWYVDAHLQPNWRPHAEALV